MPLPLLRCCLASLRLLALLSSASRPLFPVPPSVCPSVPIVSWLWAPGNWKKSPVLPRLLRQWFPDLQSPACPGPVRSWSSGGWGWCVCTSACHGVTCEPRSLGFAVLTSADLPPSLTRSAPTSREGRQVQEEERHRKEGNKATGSACPGEQPTGLCLWNSGRCQRVRMCRRLPGHEGGTTSALGSEPVPDGLQMPSPVSPRASPAALWSRSGPDLQTPLSPPPTGRPQPGLLLAHRCH